MQLRAEQLGAHLSAPPGGSLSACYLFSGDEPLLLNDGCRIVQYLKKFL
jgi:hypothetical protein